MRYCNEGTCPCKYKYEPIVLPVRECVHNCCYYVEQPIICPVNYKTVNHYIPRPVYYQTITTSMDEICHGQQKEPNK
ncbi:MAG: hypothetical protein PUA56_01695 [Bacillales bacterium]|nr:hypothetical protein [Bacillales bacterium]